MSSVSKEIGYGDFLKKGFTRIDAIHSSTNIICEKFPTLDRDDASMLAIQIIDSLVNQFDGLCEQHSEFEHEGQKFRLVVVSVEEEAARSDFAKVVDSVFACLKKEEVCLSERLAGTDGWSNLQESDIAGVKRKIVEVLFQHWKTEP